MKRIKNKKEIIEKAQKKYYGFDYEHEFDIYRKIGTEKKRGHNTENFHKYTEWKEYIQKKYYQQKDSINFYRYLKKKQRDKEKQKDVLTVLTIPTEICVIGILFQVIECKSLLVYIIVLLVVIAAFIFFFICEFFKIRDELFFVEDYMEILFEELDDVKNK